MGEAWGAAGAGLGNLGAGIGLGDLDSAGLEPGGTEPDSSLAEFSSCGL
jgi:hypothetical protein